MMWRGIIEEYRQFLPVNDSTPVVSLLEGNTPLVRADWLSERLQLDLWLKFEGLNPTGSFKDRGMTMAVSKAKEAGAEAIICASTGNTSAAAAAYAARCGMRAIVVIPDGKIAMGKMAQAIMYGAKIVAIQGNFDEALRIVRDVAEKHPITLVNSVNPFRIEGQKTAAFEICDVLGDAPDYLAIPVGNAGNISAYWKGFVDYYEAKQSSRRAIMVGFEAAGAAPIVLGHPVATPETFATAIRIGNPASWDSAVRAATESGGLIDSVTDEQIREAYKLVAREGIFCEPASAASVAGVLKLVEQGRLQAGSRVVCVLTGNGLKDPNSALASHVDDKLITKVDASEKSVVSAIFHE